MGKIIDIDFRTGSLANRVAGSIPTAVSPQFNRTDKGLSLFFNGSNTSLTYPENLGNLIGTSDFSIEVVFKTNKFSGNQYIMYCGSVGTGVGITFVLSKPNGYLQLYITDTSNGNSVSNLILMSEFQRNTWYHVIFTADRNGIATGFLNSVQKLQSSIASSAGSLSPSNSITLSSSYGYLDGSISLFRIYDYVLSEKERILSYRDFLNSYPQFPEKHPQQSLLCKPMDLSTEKDNTLGDNTLTGLAWSPDIGWAQVGDKLIASNTNSYILTIPSPIIAGKKYKVTYILTHISGTVFTSFEGAGSTVGTYRTSSGTYSEDIIGLVSGHFYFNGIAFTGTIEFVSCQEVTGLVAAYNFVPNGNILTDISGNGHNITLTNSVQTLKGLTTKDGYSGIGNTFSFEGDFSISFRMTPKGSSEYSTIIYHYGSSNSNIWVWTYGGYLWLDQNSGGSAMFHAFTVFNIPHNITLTFVSSTHTTTCYVNGNQVELPLTSYNPSGSRTAIFYLLSPGLSDFWRNKDYGIEDMRIHNRILSIQEIKDYNNSFVKPSFIEDFSSEGADGIAKVPSGWTKKFASFKINEWQIETKGNMVSTYLIAYGSQVDNGDGSVTFTVTTKVGDIQGIYKLSFMSVGKKYKFSFYGKSSNYTGTFFYIGQTVSSDVKIINNPNFTTSYQYYEFELFGEEQHFFLGFNNAEVGTNFTIKNLFMEEVAPLPSFKPGTKYLETLENWGFADIPSIQSYGTWEWDMYKNSTNNMSFVLFIAYGSVAYSIRLHSNNAIYFQRWDAAGNPTSICITAEYYIIPKIWYRIKITRDVSNEFTLFIKGGYFTPTNTDLYDEWTLISTSGGYSTNPVIDSTYTSCDRFGISNFASDRITNIKILDGIKRK